MNRFLKGGSNRDQQSVPSPLTAEMESKPTTQSVEGDTSPAAIQGYFWSVGASLLFIGAVGISLFLAWQSWVGSSVPGCGAGSGCGDVLASRWGNVGGISVALFGAGAYAVLLVSAMMGIPKSSWRLRLERGISLLVLASALWFTIVQLFLLKALCPWCCTVHGMAVAGVFMLWRSREEAVSSMGKGFVFAEFVFPMAAIAGVALFQGVARQPERIQQRSMADSVVSEADKLVLHQGRITLPKDGLPVIGLPQAAVSAVALTDFTCPHCRELHHHLAQLAEQRPDQFRAILLPAAYEPEARELHRVMLALWRVDAELYRKLADEIVEGTLDPNVGVVVGRAQKFLDGRFYELAWAHAGWVQDTLHLGDELQKLNEQEGGATTLPQTLIHDRILTGAPSVETLAGILDSGPAPTTPAIASAPVPAVVVPTEGGGVISFESTTVDLGTVTRGEPLTRKVTFENTGAAPLTITKIKTSCGCTTVKGWEQTVGPGQRGAFELTLDTTKFTGPVTKTVDVESNGTNGSVRLNLKADVWSPVRVFPPVVSFGTTLKGNKVEPRLLDITVTEPESTRISGLTCSNPYFQTELKTLEEGRRYQIVVSVADLGDRPQSGELTLEVGHPKLKDMKIPVHVSPVDPLMVQPNLLNVSVASLKTSPSKSITVFCHDPAIETLEVTDMSYSGGGDVKLAFEPEGNKRWGRLVVTFPDGFTPSQGLESTLSFRTNHPAYPQVSVPVKFFGPAVIVKKSPVATATH